MRILQILPAISSTSGGPVRSTLANCRALTAVDPDTSLTLAATRQGLDPVWHEEFERRMPAGMDLHLFPAVGQHTFTFSIPLLTWVWCNVQNYDLVVVRALLHPISSSAARIARYQGVPYLLVPHGTLSEYTFRHRRTALKRLYYRLVDAGTVGGASAVRFTSPAERDEARRLNFDTPGVVIPHPYEPRTDESAPVTSRPDQVLFLARLDPKKRGDLLVEATRIVQQHAPSMRLVLAGSRADEYERQIRSQIRGLGLKEVVELPGFVEGDEKRRLLMESGLFVLLSEQENFGVSVVEAMDAGLPVVITKGVDIWPKIHEAGAGIVLEENSPEAAAEAILRMLSDARGREDMGRRGRKLVRTAFDPKRVGRGVSHLYRAAADGPRRVREKFS